VRSRGTKSRNIPDKEEENGRSINRAWDTKFRTGTQGKKRGMIERGIKRMMKSQRRRKNEGIGIERIRSLAQNRGRGRGAQRQTGQYLNRGLATQGARGIKKRKEKTCSMSTNYKP
jgi:hypothetical protein